VYLDVEPGGLGDMHDLHCPGNAEIVLGVHVDHVAPAPDQELGLLLDAADVLAHQHRRLQALPQPAMAGDRDPAVAVGILVPKAPDLIAHASHRQGVHPRAELAGRIEHERHVIADPCPYLPEALRFTRDVAVVPAVNLEAVEPAFLAGGSVVGKCGRRVETAGRGLPVIGARISGQPLAKRAQHRRHRHAVLPPGQIPEGNVERALSHVVIGAQFALHIVVQGFAMGGIAPDQHRRQHLRLPQRSEGTHPVRHVGPHGAVIGADADGKAGWRQGCALLKDDVADTGAAGLPDSQVGKREVKDVDFNAIDGAHAGSLSLPIRVR